MQDNSLNLYQIISLVKKEIYKISLITFLFTSVVLAYFYFYQNYTTVQVEVREVSKENINYFSKLNNLINFYVSKNELPRDLSDKSMKYNDLYNYDLINSRYLSKLNLITPENLYQRFLDKFQRNEVFTSLIFNEYIIDNKNMDQDTTRAAAFNYTRSFQLKKIINDNRIKEYFVLEFNTKSIDKDVENLHKAIKAINLSIVLDIIFELNEIKNQIIHNRNATSEILKNNIAVENKFLLAEHNTVITNIRDQLEIARILDIENLNNININSSLTILQSLHEYEMGKVPSIYFEGREVLEKKLDLLENKNSENLSSTEKHILEVSLVSLEQKNQIIDKLSKAIAEMEESQKFFSAIDINLNDKNLNKSLKYTTLLPLLISLGFIISLLVVFILEGYKNFLIKE